MKTYELLLLCMIIVFVLSEDKSDNTEEDSEIVSKTNPNATVEDTTLDNPVPLNPNKPPTYTFLAISNFNKKKKNPNDKNDNTSEISITIWVKRIDGTRETETMTITIILNTGRRLRLLAQETQDVKCYPRSGETDTIPYDCSMETEKDVLSLEADPKSIKMPGVDIKVSPYAEEQMKHLQDQTKDITLEKLERGDIHFGTLYNANITYYSNNFKLEGDLDDAEFPSGTLYLTLPKKNSDDNINATCNFIPEGEKKDKKGTLTCGLPKDVDEATTLEGKVATDEKGNSLLAITMNEPNIPIVNKEVGINNYSRQKSSDGGLSGGAIAGIVIACAVALVAAAITAVVCRAPAKPPLQEESTLGVNTNNVIVN
jgi:hypothetical protein